jgi:cell wall-associated NlpC family hydrolase
VASHRLKRSMGGALVATAVVAGTVTSVPAFADPQPNNPSDALKQYTDIAHQAEAISQQLEQAKVDHQGKIADLDRAKGDAARADQVANQARAEEEKFRSQVDQLTHASYEGARMNKLSALLISKTPRDFLSRASTLESLSRDNDRAVQAYSSATKQATTAEQQANQARDRAAQAEADAGRIENDLRNKQSALQAQEVKVHQQFEQLSSQDVSSLSSTTNVGQLLGSGAAILAVNAALAKQGARYVYGADGPSQFDCSGLMQWAYRMAGISIPRTSQAQASAGRPVSASELQPGDLIIFYSDESHVGMYIGNGNVVHAPEESEPVKVTPYKYIGSVAAMRRIVG